MSFSQYKQHKENLLSKELFEAMKQSVDKLVCSQFGPQNAKMDADEIWDYYRMHESCGHKVETIFLMPNHFGHSKGKSMPSGSVVLFNQDSLLCKEAFSESKRLCETTMLFKIVNSRKDALSNKEALAEFNKLIKCEGEEEEEEQQPAESHYHYYNADSKQQVVSSLYPSLSSFKHQQSGHDGYDRDNDDDDDGDVASYGAQALCMSTRGPIVYEDPFNGLDDADRQALRRYLLSKKDDLFFSAKLSRKGSHVSLLTTECNQCYLCVHTHAERSASELLRIIDTYSKKHKNMTIAQFMDQYPFVEMHQQNVQRTAKHLAYDCACYIGVQIETDYDSQAKPRNKDGIRPRMGVPFFVQTSNNMMMLPFIGNSAKYREYASLLSKRQNIPYGESCGFFDASLSSDTRPVFFNMCCFNPLYHPWHLKQAQLKHKNNPRWHVNGYTTTRLSMSSEEHFVESASKKMRNLYQGTLNKVTSLAKQREFLLEGGEGPVIQKFVTFTGHRNEPVLLEAVHDDIGFIDKMYTRYTLHGSNTNLTYVPDSPAFVAFPCFVSKKRTTMQQHLASPQVTFVHTQKKAHPNSLTASKQSNRKKRQQPNVFKILIGAAIHNEEEEEEEEKQSIHLQDSEKRQYAAQEPEEEKRRKIGGSASHKCIHLWGADDCDQESNESKYESFEKCNMPALSQMGFMPKSTESIKSGKVILQNYAKLLAKHSNS